MMKSQSRNFSNTNLEKTGYDVKTASDGFKAVDIAKKFHPDLVLLDIMMPKMDGVETCRLLREIPELQKTFIVFLTARSERIFGSGCV